MAGKIIDAKSASITAATSAGYVTVASSTGFYKNAFVWLNKAGQPEVECKILVISGNDIGVQILPELGKGPKYTLSDISAYNGGTISQFSQFVYNPNDKPLD